MLWKDSTDRFNDYMKITGPNPSVLTHIGFNYLNLNDLNTAMVFFKRSLKILPTDINTLTLLGDTFLAQGKTQKAREQYRLVLNLNKDYELEKILQAKIKKIIPKKTIFK